MRPRPSSQRCTAPQVRYEASERRSPASDSDSHQGQVEAGALSGLWTGLARGFLLHDRGDGVSER